MLRPPPNPAKGRISYPTAATYTPGDVDSSPAAILPSSPESNHKTWWKSSSSSRPEPPSAQGVFGIPLADSVDFASVQISTAGDDGSLYVWGVIPVVVAKCGLHLKETATEVEGAFRISGSAKRMRELQTIFETGPKYGKNIDWPALGFTPHDVATIFRRFLTQMPEPIVPFEMYEPFRETLYMDDPIPRYKDLIRSMPANNRYLLLYVLDLLHVFALKSDINLMTAANLALIFQPGVLSHPMHAMRPSDHALSQQTLEFLINHQDHFLIGMPTKKTKAKPEPKPKPPPVKADPDFMLPSDSDDEAPEGGYYVVEAEPKSPKVAQPELSHPTFTAQDLSRQDLSRQKSPQTHTHLQVKPTTSAPRAIPQSPRREDVHIAPSDSDDEAPPGGYEIHQGDPDKHRANLLAQSDKSIQPQQLNRRKTLPVKLTPSKSRRNKSKESP